MTPSVASLIATESRLGAHNYKPLDVVLARGADIWVWDVAGKRYLDCLAAYSAVNQGHCHPRILAALVAQAGRLTITSRAFHNDQLALLYEDLAALTCAHKILPMNSGAEAVESAIKAVRKWGYELKGVAPDQAEITGRLLNSMGQGMPNARVTLTDTAGETRSVMANGFGAYRFGALTVGQTYTISVESKQLAFTPLTVSVTGETVNVDLIAD